MRFLTFSVRVLLVGAILHPSIAFGQTLDGRVIDPDEAPIPGAFIAFRLESRELVARVAADDEGYFRIRHLDPGAYFVVVERLGFRTTETPLFLREGDSVTVELRMDVDAIPLEPIVVTASPRPRWEYTEPPALWEFWERKDYLQKLGIGEFHTYQDLKPLQGSQVSLAIIQLNPFLIPVPHEDRVNTFLIGGRTGCSPLIFLDGHQLRPDTGRTQGRSMLLGSPPGPVVDDYISLSLIAAVEVYRGASDVPGEFRFPGANCGVVAIWSRRGIVR